MSKDGCGKPVNTESGYKVRYVLLKTDYSCIIETNLGVQFSNSSLMRSRWVRFTWFECNKKAFLLSLESAGNDVTGEVVTKRQKDGEGEGGVSV